MIQRLTEPEGPAGIALVTVVSIVPGLVLGFLLSGFYPPFGMAAGLFGGSAGTFFLVALSGRLARG